MSDAENNKWKQKYLRGLGELEQREQQWQELEELLRRALGRLAHTGYGMDRVLDNKLDLVRDAVRGRREIPVLDRLVREASETAVHVQESAQKAGAESGRALADLITRLPLTGPSKRKADELCKELRRATAMDQIRPLLSRAGALIDQAGADSPENVDAPPAGPTRREGLLGRLLSHRSEPTPEPPDPSPIACAQVMERFLDRLQAPSSWAERLATLREQAAACRQEADAYQLLDETAAIMAEILQTAERADPDARLVVDSLPAAGEALLELVEKLEIPQPLQERVGVIKNSLARAATPNQVHIAVHSIAELLGEMRRLVQDEKQDLERFLEGVTSRIRTLSEHVAELGQNRYAATEGRAAFQSSLQDHMDTLRSNVRDTDDLADLKRAIEAGLDTIEEQMQAYVLQEENLSREAQERIADLSNRLHDMKHEALLLQQQMRQQREMALKDPLTGVYNRLAYEERIEAEFGRWRRYGDPLSLVLLDVDHFKKVNDSLGHLAGDKALKAMALRVLQNVREVDFVARYGGEEFVVIMPNTAAEHAFAVAEKLRTVVATAGFHYNREPVIITVSCGVASFGEGDDPGRVFNRADNALYAAKQAGRNCTKREEASPAGAGQVE
jgi:diguanylate cyclase